jgi:hypothetical protein
MPKQTLTMTIVKTARFVVAFIGSALILLIALCTPAHPHPSLRKHRRAQRRNRQIGGVHNQ